MSDDLKPRNAVNGHTPTGVMAFRGMTRSKCITGAVPMQSAGVAPTVDLALIACMVAADGRKVGIDPDVATIMQSKAFRKATSARLRSTGHARVVATSRTGRVMGFADAFADGAE